VLIVKGRESISA